MAVEIKEVSTKKELRIFSLLHKQHYKDHEYYIPQLDSEMLHKFNREKSAELKKVSDMAFFLAYKDGKPVGRITAHVIPEHNQVWKDNLGWFGFWITPNDEEVAFALLDTAYNWIKERGLDAMRGPGEFVFPEIGMVVEGFTSHHNLMIPYNYYYYKDLIEAYKTPDKRKVEKVVDMVCYYYDVAHGDLPEKIKRINAKMKQRSNFTIRPINMKGFEHDVKGIFRIFDEAWKDNFGSIPLGDDVMDEVKESLKMILDPNMILMVENDKQEIIAFQIVLPDANEAIRDLNGRLFWPPWNFLKLLWRLKVRRTRWCRLWATGILKDYRKKGIDAMLYEEMIVRGRKRGYKHCDISWQLESNYDINRAIEAVGGKYYRRLRLYEFLIKEGVKTSRPVLTQHTDALAERMGYKQ